MLSNITLGQFIPGKSFLHKLDPRSKIFFVICYIVLIFFCNSYFSSFVMLLSIFFIMYISHIKISNYFKSMKMILFIVIFTSLMNVFYSQDSNSIFEFGFIKITESGISNSVFVAVRLISLIIISSVLTFTTSPNDLTDAIEWGLSPLKIFKIDVHSIAMMMTIALRFVPTLLEETNKIMNAQKSRGANIENGNIIEKTKSLVPILVPLFVSAFRRAYDLAIAMECRCYRGGKGKTRMKTLKFSNRDLVAFLAIISLYLVVFSLCY